MIPGSAAVQKDALLGAQHPPLALRLASPQGALALPDLGLPPGVGTGPPETHQLSRLEDMLFPGPETPPAPLLARSNPV